MEGTRNCEHVLLYLVLNSMCGGFDKYNQLYFYNNTLHTTLTGLSLPATSRTGGETFILILILFSMGGWEVSVSLKIEHRTNIWPIISPLPHLRSPREKGFQLKRDRISRNWWLIKESKKCFSRRKGKLMNITEWLKMIPAGLGSAARSGSAVRIVNMMRLENISHFTHHVAGDCILGVEIHQFDVLLTRWTIRSCARHIPDWGRPIIWSYQYKTNGGETNKEPQPESR